MPSLKLLSKKKTEQTKKTGMTKIMAVCFLALVALSGAASAEMNTTAITEAIAAFTVILPSIANMIMAIVPTLLTLGIIGFIFGFWDSILEMIKGLIKFG
jgi:hypothetical protein